MDGLSVVKGRMGSVNDVVAVSGDPVRLRRIAGKLLVVLGSGVLGVFLGLAWSQGDALSLALFCVCVATLGAVLFFRTSIREYGARTDEAGARAPAWAVILISIPLLVLCFVLVESADLDGDSMFAVLGSFVAGGSAVLWFRVRLELRQIEAGHSDTTGE